MTDNITVLYIRKQVIKFKFAMSVVVSTVNFIHSRGLNHCMFHGHMWEADAVYGDAYQKGDGKSVIVSCSVSWKLGAKLNNFLK
jgi:hypothetical protein